MNPAVKKPFDPKELVNKLKDQGLDIAEDAGRILVDAVFDWAEESVQLTPNKFDDMALAVSPVLRKYLLKKIDELDGEQDHKHDNTDPQLQ